MRAIQFALIGAVLTVTLMVGVPREVHAATAVLQLVVVSGQGEIDEQITVTIEGAYSQWHGGTFHCNRLGGPTHADSYTTFHAGIGTYDYPADPNMYAFHGLSTGDYDCYATADLDDTSHIPYIPYSVSTGTKTRTLN